MASQKGYLMAGILLSIIFAIRFVLFFMSDHKEPDVYLVELLNWGSIAFMAFCYSYLYPQFKEKDERTQSIRQRGIYYSMFFVLVSLIVIMLLTQYGVMALSTILVVRILISLIIMAMALSWVILSKQM